MAELTARRDSVAETFAVSQALAHFLQSSKSSLKNSCSNFERPTNEDFGNFHTLNNIVFLL
jgi:hypothetical protein